MKAEEFARLEEMFMGIRDEKGVHRNTAVRIGTAFLELLRYASSGEFDEITFNKVLNKPTFLEGLITLGSIVFGEYAAGLQGGVITEEGVAELKRLWVRESTKLGDGSVYRDEAGKVLPALEVKGNSTFSGNLSSPEFVSAFLGGLGWAIQKKEVENAAGEIEEKYTLEIDNITVRNTLRVFEFVVSQMLGENDNRVFTSMLEVHHYDPETGKIWLSTDGGRFYNPFRAGDCVMVQQYQADNDASSGGDGYITKTYEMVLTDAGTGGMEDENGGRLDWVTFKDFTTTMEDEDGNLQTPEQLIVLRDSLTRVDSLTDPDRKGIITVMSVGNNTPYIDIIHGLKTDPKRSLKGRLGNLEGINTDVFGWLEGFGAYLNNLYGVGKFFNAQTGENMMARIEMSLQRFRSFYKETVYNITEEENFFKNGFFQSDLSYWEAININGTTPDSEETRKIVGLNGNPLLFNGHMISSSSKKTAEIVEKDGINVLHLQSMGVAQAFSYIKTKGQHLQMKSDDVESTETIEVDDRMYLGVRILPETSGTLTVKFVKENGTYTYWQKEIDSSLDWVLYQGSDSEAQPWDWTGSGKCIVSYTGECFIRFVVLSTDPVANVQEDYSTLIQQTGRRITLEASKQTSDLNEAVARIELEYDNITTTVTNNKTAADRAFANLTDDLEDETASRQALENLYKGTWVYQNDSLLSLMAAQFNADGTIIGYSDLKVQVNEISTTVTNNKTAADNAFNTLNNTTLPAIRSDITSAYNLASSADSKAGNAQNGVNSINATWVIQNSDRLSLVSAQFDSSGNLTNTSGLVTGDGSFASLYSSAIANDGSVAKVADISVIIDDYGTTNAAINADKINFVFTESTYFYAKDGGTQTAVMKISPNGDLWIKGEFRGGSITQDVQISSDVKFYVNNTKYAQFSNTSEDYEPMLFIRHDSGRGISIISTSSSAKGLYVNTTYGTAIHAVGACTFSPGDGKTLEISNGYFAPRCAVKTSSFTLPTNAITGTMFFCKGVTSDLTVTTTSLPIQAPDSKSSYVDTYSSRNFGDDAFMLICTGGYWAWFRCD